MQGQSVPAAGLSRKIGWKALAVLIVGVALGAVAAYALQRELKARPQAPSPAVALGSGIGDQQSAPALSADEEAYAAALWPIHSEVKLSAVRMIFAGLNYKVEGSDVASLKAAVKPLTKNFKDAAQRVRRLQPPSSLKEAHGSYLRALENYTAASQEMIKVADDGREQHLLAAHKSSAQASEQLLRLSDVLWPGEYKPN